MVIVESDDVQCSTLEEVVLGVGFIASCSDGTSGVVATDDGTQVAGEYRVDAQFLSMSESGCIMSCIEYKVSLFGGEIISISRRPLFEYLVAYAPHEDRGMIAVAQYKVGEVALCPFVKKSGIVVLSLASAPHIKRLIHDYKSHRVTHGEQFGRWRIMRAAYGVGAHLLQYAKLAMKGIFIDSRTQATEVMVLAHTVYLHRLSVERESLGGIEFEGTESSGGLVCIHHFASSHYFSPQGIYIR